MLTSQPPGLHRPGDPAPGAHRPARSRSSARTARRRATSTTSTCQDVPLDPAKIIEHKGDAAARWTTAGPDHRIHVPAGEEETEFLEVFLRNGSTETLYWKDLLSGALLNSVVERAKDFAIKRSIDEELRPRGHHLRRPEARRPRRVQGERDLPERRRHRRLAASCWTMTRRTSPTIKPIKGKKQARQTRRSII